SREVSAPRACSPSISSKSASRFTTTPLPITGTAVGERMPAGRSLSSYFSPPTTTVCPALLPPLGLTTYSTRPPRMSVALPLPSSPHWAPISTIAGMVCFHLGLLVCRCGTDVVGDSAHTNAPGYQPGGP